jgi:hypothetical protein
MHICDITYHIVNICQYIPVLSLNIYSTIPKSAFISNILKYSIHIYIGIKINIYVYIQIYIHLFTYIHISTCFITENILHHSQICIHIRYTCHCSRIRSLMIHLQVIIYDICLYVYIHICKYI